MRTSLTIPDDLEVEIQRRAEMLKEKPATILRLALRAGLPTVGEASSRPYEPRMFEGNTDERRNLASAMSKTDVSSQERDLE